MIFENIVTLCKREKITIAALEKKCGLGNSTIRGWKTATPRAWLLKRVAEHFGVSVDWLMTSHDGKGETKN